MSVQSAFQLPVLHSTSSASRCTLKRLLILVLRCTTKEDADYTCPWIIETTEKVIYLVNILGWLILFDVWRQQRGLQRHLFWDTCKTGGWFYLPEGTLIQFEWCLTVAFSLRVFSNIYILSLFVVPIFQHYFTLKPLWHACPSPRCGHQKKKKKNIWFQHTIQHRKITPQESDSERYRANLETTKLTLTRVQVVSMENLYRDANKIRKCLI